MIAGLYTRRNKARAPQLDGMEDFLSGAFAPVAPSRDFVNHLGKRLTSYPTPIPEAPTAPAQIWRYTFLAVISVLGGGLLLAMLLRYLISLIATLGNWRLSRGHAGPEAA